MADAPEYAELHCWSNFSFLEGSSHPEELVEHGARLGLRGIALTDRDGLYGAVRFAKAAVPVPPFAALCGAELTLESDGVGADPRQPAGAARQRSADRHAAARADRRRQDRLRQPRPAHLDRPAARPQARCAPAARRPRRPHRRADRALRRAQRAGREGAAAARHRRPLSRLGARLRDLFPGRFYLELQHHVAARGSGAGARDGAPGDAARRAVRRDQRRRVRDARGRAAVRRADVREVHDVAAERRHAAAPQPRAPSQDARADGAPVRRVSARDPQHARGRRAAARSGSTSCAASFRSTRSPTTRRRRSRTCARSSTAAPRSCYAQPLDPKVERQLEYELGIIARMDLAGYFLVVWDIANAASAWACSRKAAARRRTRRSATRSGSPRSTRSRAGFCSSGS